MAKGSGGTRGAAGGGSGSRGSGLQRTLASFESSVRGLSYENSAIIDANGNIIEMSKGEEGRVGYDALLAIGKTVTHNHPSGGSLSKKDIMGAIQSNLTEVRAVTSSYTFSMKPSKSGWGVENSGQKGILLNGVRYNGVKLKPTSQMLKVQKAYKTAQSKVESRIKAYVSSSSDKKAASARAGSIKWHMVNKEFAKSMGYTYTATKVK